MPTIGNFAFYDISGLTIYIPSSVLAIDGPISYAVTIYCENQDVYNLLSSDKTNATVDPTKFN